MVALPGTTLPGDFHIATRKTYGRISDGMICSAAELGLGTDHSGILVLPPGTAEPGADGIDVLGLDDVVFDLAITPDRGYCLSVRGLAREIACAYDLDFVDPADVRAAARRGRGLAADGRSRAPGCSRFALRPVTGIDQHALSPWWLRRRLMLCGIRPISPAVDVTNYVMLELGHPMHAHDRDRINGGFDVRFAEPGETVVTLDDVERTLDPADVLIVDDVATAAIGGVMGAGTTEIDDDSTDVLLEAAVWDPAAVSRTQRRLHLVSEAGRRYERAVDPAISVAALDRCAALLADIAGGVVEPTLTDWRGDPPRDDWSQPPVRMAVDLPDRTAGVELPRRRRPCARLTQIGARVPATTPIAAVLVVTPPSWRPDLVQPADLVEEVLRLEGLDVIPSVLPAAPAGRGLTAVQKRRRAIGKSLALSGLRRDPAHPVPARRGLRHLGSGRRRSAPHHAPRCSTRWRPTVRSWPPRCCPALLEALVPQRVSWRRRCRAVRDRAGRAADRADRGRRADPDRSPAHRRRDRDAGRVAAAPAAARRRGADRAARTARAVGARAAPSRPPTRSRRCGSSPAPPVSR